MTADELMAMVDGLCEAAYSAQDTEALRASLRTALEAVVEGCRQETAPVQGLTDEQIDAIAAPWLAPDGQANDSDVRQIVRAALAAAPHAAPVVQPVVPAGWKPIETAPRGSGEDGPSGTRHPDYVAPPKLLLWTQEGPVVGYYDWYYHPGYGRGAEHGESVWRDHDGGRTYGASHWMPLPAAPASHADSMPAQPKEV